MSRTRREVGGEEVREEEGEERNLRGLGGSLADLADEELSAVLLHDGLNGVELLELLGAVLGNHQIRRR